MSRRPPSTSSSPVACMTRPQQHSLRFPGFSGRSLLVHAGIVVLVAFGVNRVGIAGGAKWRSLSWLVLAILLLMLGLLAAVRRRHGVLWGYLSVASVLSGAGALLFAVSVFRNAPGADVYLYAGLSAFIASVVSLLFAFRLVRETP